MSISLSILPAGTTSNFPSICIFGKADPQLVQKHLMCPSERKLKVLTFSWPDNHLNLVLLPPHNVRR
jgi:hypothetical protein